ncbi:MAG: phage major capsid protein [Candidatus Nitrosotenuis sp.]
MANPNFDALVTTTLKNYRKNLADNITAHQALFMQLKKKGFIREEDGGTSIVEPLLVGKNTTVRSYSGYDVLDVTPQAGVTAAEFAWKQIAGSVTISGEEEFKNSGSATRVLSLLETKIKQLEISMTLEINRQLFGDGTGNGGKDITGLALAVEDGTAWSVYGGIDSNAYTYWRNQWIGSVGSFAANGVDRMRTLFNSASRGTEKPTLIITTQAIFEAYEKSLSPALRFSDPETADAGFMNLLFRGVPVVFDDDAPAGELRMLNSEYLRLVIGKGRNFSVTPFVRPENQDAKVSQILFYGNLTCNNRARQGVLTGITTP